MPAKADEFLIDTVSMMGEASANDKLRISREQG
jgi:hypothetical protein